MLVFFVISFEIREEVKTLQEVKSRKTKPDFNKERVRVVFPSVKKIFLSDLKPLEDEEEKKKLEKFKGKGRGEYLRSILLDDTKKISITNDIMFRYMIQNPSRIKYACKILSYFINVDYEILLDSLTLIQTESTSDKVNGKRRQGDFAAKIGNNYINIEVNNNYRKPNIKRNLDFLCRIFDRYFNDFDEDKYNLSLQININNFYYKEVKDWCEVYYLESDKSGLGLLEDFVIIEIFLPRLKKKWYDVGIDKLSELEKILLTTYVEDIRKAKELGGEIKIMEEYIDEAMTAKDDTLVLESIDYVAEEREEGRAQGRRENTLEIAKKLLDENVDINIIASTTNLTKEEIENLK